jgi:hypothetical protein
MIWVLLAAVGVPLWLCALAIVTLVVRNRSLRKRPGNVAVRLRTPGSRRWKAGHLFWTHDVLAFRGSPAAWQEALLWVTAAQVREASAEERKKLHRIGDRPVVATFTLEDETTIEVAARAEDEDRLLGSFRASAVHASARPAVRAATQRRSGAAARR